MSAGADKPGCTVVSESQGQPTDWEKAPAKGTPDEGPPPKRYKNLKSKKQPDLKMN